MLGKPRSVVKNDRMDVRAGRFAAYRQKPRPHDFANRTPKRE
jgi:hypothetical protein